MEQGCDNGANMAGMYNGAQAVLLKENGNCTFSGCGNHTLNLVGVDSAESCKEAIAFFGTVQQVYNFFSGSPYRWKILKKIFTTLLPTQYFKNQMVCKARYRETNSSKFEITTICFGSRKS